jgi:hypothetical protein
MVVDFECNIWCEVHVFRSICGMLPDVQMSVCGCREGLYPVEVSGYYWIQ